MTGPLMVPRIQRNKDHRGATIEPSSPAAESPILLLNLDRRRLRRFDLGFSLPDADLHRRGIASASSARAVCVIFVCIPLPP